MMGQAEALMKVRQDAVDKVQSTFNPIIKAAEYSKALDAMERLSYYDMDRINSIPTNKEVIPICQSVMIASTGLLWSRALMGSEWCMGVPSLVAAMDCLSPPEDDLNGTPKSFRAPESLS
jgi:hypothetical protein